MHELDNEIGDIENEINDIELDILTKLKNYTEKYTSQIKIALDFISNIDMINSLAISSAKHNLVKPVCSKTIKSDFLKLVRFEEKTKKDSINECKSEQIDEVDHQKNGMVMYTKKNSGFAEIRHYINDNTKPETEILYTDYEHIIKLGQIIVMQQIGTYIPEDIELPVFEKIYSKISTHESLIARKSAFFNDILQISEVYKFNGDNAILLIDEFGRGTNIYEGRALYQSILLHTHVSAIVCNEIFLAESNIHLNENFSKYPKDMLPCKINNNKIELFRSQFRDIKGGKYKIPEENLEDEWATKIINDYLFKQP